MIVLLNFYFNFFSIQTCLAFSVSVFNFQGNFICPWLQTCTDYACAKGKRKKKRYIEMWTVVELENNELKHKRGVWSYTISNKQSSMGNISPYQALNI